VQAEPARPDSRRRPVDAFPRAELERTLGAAPVRWEPVASGGYGRNSAHWRVALADGRSAFVKQALDDDAADWLRDEQRLYGHVRGSFLAELRGWHEDGETLLAIEDLTHAHWPPPWPDGGIDAVLAALEEVHRTPPPPGLRRLADLRDWLDGWPAVLADPEPLLATGLCSGAWLESALPVLAKATASCELDGASLVHLDVRSDNLCFAGDRVILVDWNLAAVGNPLIDAVAWLPSRHLEGGPEPWGVVADSGGLAALMAGFFASRAGLPPPPTAPTVREFQRRQAEVAIPWAARELGLPPNAVT
jgi:hypothetical protein